MSDLLDICLKNAGINQKEEHLLIKTKELLRKLDIKLPQHVRSGISHSKHLVCMEIACRMLHIPFASDSFMKQSIANEKEYRLAYNTYKILLGLETIMVDTLNELYLQYGEDYRMKVSDVLNCTSFPICAEARNFERESPILGVVCLFFVLSLDEILIDINVMVRHAEINIKTFRSILQTIQQNYLTGGENAAVKGSGKLIETDDPRRNDSLLKNQRKYETLPSFGSKRKNSILSSSSNIDKIEANKIKTSSNRKSDSINSNYVGSKIHGMESDEVIRDVSILETTVTKEMQNATDEILWGVPQALTREDYNIWKFDLCKANTVPL